MVMKFQFDEFQLDPGKFELRRAGDPVKVEPQVFSLLVLLLEHRDRLVTKDEIVHHVWGGDAVSDASIASRVRLARQAIGDDGRVQKYIRTVHGRGYRFIADEEALQPDPAPAETRQQADPPEEQSGGGNPAGSKPSIAVLPFQLTGAASEYAGFGDAIPHELIQALSSLRWLLVIARGSSFRFRDNAVDVREVGRRLDVRYCLTGAIELTDRQAIVTVELSDTSHAGIVWSERFSAAISELHMIRSDIVANVVAALEIHIPSNEANFASIQAPDSLDSWANYHLGLQQMFHFTPASNARAAVLFQRAIARDPRFARAHAGLSFTHFIDAFVKFGATPRTAAENARRHAEMALELDAHDPFANLTMGRAYWLTGDPEKSLPWLDRATSLSPNYAQGHYSRGFAEMVLCETSRAREHADQGMRLSPLDPLLYGMLGTRALTYITDENYEEAVFWADQAARAPGAHYLISMIAVAAHQLNGNEEKALRWLEDIRKRRTDASQADFFDAFPFTQHRVKQRISDALGQFKL